MEWSRGITATLEAEGMTTTNFAAAALVGIVVAWFLIGWMPIGRDAKAIVMGLIAGFVVIVLWTP